MRYFSTFSGIGGFELGIQLAYESNNEHAHLSSESESKERSQGRVGSLDFDGVQLHTRNRTAPLCVGFSEIDKYASQIYQKHFPTHYNYGDITEINAKELPDFELLVGGFQCQSFSIAGKRGGFNDTRGTMFFELARIIKEKQPRLFVFENVKGLLSHDKGFTFYTIITTLDELGYDCQWQVLNSKNHGVPQNRERVFIIGHLRGTSRPEVFPFGESKSGNIESSRDDSKTSRTISARFSKGVGNTESRIIDVLVDTVQSQRIRNIKGLASTLSAGGGGQGAKTGLYGVEAGIRRLTPTECERLQGFPDGWTEGVSDTQRYKTLGNAVTVNVIRDIFEKIL